jgi:hypothetical protein
MSIAVAVAIAMPIAVAAVLARKFATRQWTVHTLLQGRGVLNPVHRAFEHERIRFKGHRQRRCGMRDNWQGGGRKFGYGCAASRAKFAFAADYHSTGWADEDVQFCLCADGTFKSALTANAGQSRQITPSMLCPKNRALSSN